MREPGSRYIDFLVPGLLGIGHHGRRRLGDRLLDRRRAPPQADQAARRDADVASVHYLASYLVWRLLILWFEVGLPLGFGALVFGVPVRGRLIELAVLVVFASLSFGALGLLIARAPGPSRRSRA